MTDEPTDYASGSPENSGAASLAPITLSLSEFHRILEQRGIEIKYTSLSEFINTGDIADQLGATGNRNRRQFPAWGADALTEFLPLYREGRGRLPQAAEMLRSFILNRTQRDRRAEAPEGRRTPKDASEGPSVPRREAAEADAATLARLSGLAAQDKPLTAKQAAELLGVSVRVLRRSVPPYRRFGKSAAGDRWRLSDLLLSESEAAAVPPPDLPETPKMLTSTAAPLLLAVSSGYPDNSGTKV